MSEQQSETIIISLGGSLIIPNEVDTIFLKSFVDLILSYGNTGKKFVIITGGGKISRRYNAATLKIKAASSEELDWVGIHASRFNAEFVKVLFGDFASKDIIVDPTLPVNFEKSIVIGGGWKPGWSTDYVAVTLGNQLGVKRIINLSNIDYAYDSDPKVNPNAKKIENITWPEYEKIIPKEWNPGLSTPFDPIASRLAEKDGMEVVIVNGSNILNLKKCLDGEDFVGTKIK